MEEQGVHHQLTAPHTPQQNGIAERANQTIAKAAWAMRQSSGLSQGFWECAVATAVHVWNHAPSRVTNYISPHEHLVGQPIFAHFWLSCICPHHNSMKQVWSDFTETSVHRIWQFHKGVLWNPSSHKIVVSTDVVFEESTFLFRTPML